MKIENRMAQLSAQWREQQSLDTLRALPSNRLESLRGARARQYSIRINRQWRIWFTWSRGHPGPSNVEIVDYH